MANLFIGMGGSGVKTMKSLKEQLKSYDPVALDNSRFLMIDTDEDEMKQFDNHEKFNLGDVNVFQHYMQAASSKIKSDDQKRFLEWFDPKAIVTMKNGPLSLGASANRPQGRGAVAMKHQEFRKKIFDILSELTAIKTKESSTNSDADVKVYTCCSVAGGTGSSVYLDLMYLLQDVYAEQNSSLGELQLWSFLYMPEVFKNLIDAGSLVKNDYLTNVFAFWSEINAISKDYYQNVEVDPVTGIVSGEINKNVFNDFSVFKTPRDFRWKIFKNGVLIDYMTQSNKTFEAKEMYKNTADLIRYLSDNKIGSNLRSVWDNSTNRLASFSAQDPWIDSFSIAGFRALEGPNQYLKKYFKAKIFSDVFNGLINIDEQDKDTIKQKENVVAFLNAEFFPSIDCNNDINVDCTSVPNDKNLSVILQNHITEITANYSRKITQAASDKEALKEAGNSIFKEFKQTQENLINDFILKSQGENKKIIDLFHLIFSKKAEKIIQKNGVAYLKEFISILDNDCFTKYYGINKSALDELGSSDSGLGCVNVGLEQLIKTIADEISVASTIRIIGKNEDWFSSQLNKLSRAIDLYFKYQLSEFIIKFRMSIYKDLSLGDEGITDIILKRTFDLHNELQKKFSDHDKTFKYSLPAEFTALKDRVTHTVIPNVSSFVKDATWVNDTSINKFQEFYEDSSLGFSHKRNSQNEKIPVRAKDGESPWTLETVLEKLYPSETFTLLSDSIKFKNNAAIAIQIEKFENELNKYLDQVFFNREDLAIILKNSIKSWCDKYPVEFKSIQEHFRNNSPLFYKRKDTAATNETYIWLSNNKDLCDNLNGAIIAEKDFITKTEDIVVFVKCQQGISLDSYMSFDDYSNTYNTNKREKIKLFYPHIHKGFYENDDLLEYFKKSKRISESNAITSVGIEDLKKLTKNFTPFIQFLFFSYFYEELSTKSDEDIKTYITGSNFDNKESLKLIKHNKSGDSSINFTYTCFQENYITGRSQFNLDQGIESQQILNVNFKAYLWAPEKNFTEEFDGVATAIKLNIDSLRKRKSEGLANGGSLLKTFESLMKTSKEKTDAFFSTFDGLNADEKKKCLTMSKTVISELKLN